MPGNFISNSFDVRADTCQDLSEMDHYFYQIQDKLSQLLKKPYFIILVLCVASSLVCLVSLRHNNTTMAGLRNKVYSADKDNGNVELALYNLRTYVYAHMNTNLSSGTSIKPPIQLQYTYQRLQDRAKPLVNNPQLYVDANNYCKNQASASCVADYVSDHGGVAAKTIPVALYEFDFISPSWSPDLAGWSLVSTITLGMAAVALFLVGKFTRLNL